jgi:DNA-binding MarR family transcriptional regulator
MTPSPGPSRSERIDYVSSDLLPRAALLTRLLVGKVGGDLSRTEIGILSTLGGRTRRITELAELEGLAQPTITMLIKRLEEKGLVTRTRNPDDGRVVLVGLTETGSVALEDYRGQVRRVLTGALTEISDEHVESLATATETLAQLVDVLQRAGAMSTTSPRPSWRGQP